MTREDLRWVVRAARRELERKCEARDHMDGDDPRHNSLTVDIDELRRSIRRVEEFAGPG